VNADGPDRERSASGFRNVPRMGMTRLLRAVLGAALTLTAVVGMGARPADAAVDDIVTRVTTPHEPAELAVGPDSLTWFTSPETDRLVSVSLDLVTLRTIFGGGIDVPLDLVTGSDGNLWFTNFGGGQIGRLNPAADPLVLDFFTDVNVVQPVGITAGPDSNLWFTDQSTDRIGRITTAGVITTFTDPNVDGPGTITVGPDNNLWFISGDNNRIGRITTAGVITTFTNAGIQFPQLLATGPDGALWFDNTDGRLGRITTAGAVTFVDVPHDDAINGITTGPDDNLWYTDGAGNGVWRFEIGSSQFTRFSDCQQGLSGVGRLLVGSDDRIWITGANDVIGALTPQAYPAHCFTDVPNGAFYEEGLRWARSIGIVTGFPDGTYHPQDPVTRGQAVNMLWHLFGEPGPFPPHGFPDVPAGAAYNDALDWALAEGLVTGFPDGTFRGRDPVNRGQIVNILWHAAGEPGPFPDHGFPDVPANAFYDDALDWAKATGIVTGFPDGRYRPRDAVKRGQIAQMLFLFDSI
jgi:streptogramin lyase